MKAALTRTLSLRSGLFLSRQVRQRNFTELFVVGSETAPARHSFIADPQQDVHSWSGEAMLAWKIGGQHRLFAGYRFRDRHTESGGSAFRDYGDVTYGERDP